ncbi:MAG: DegT/DnrJ/EryC1/StrS aminotransferase family protein [Dehalococcoidia bacterium]|nr:DegT/DnrJ/EryC1/StrS aminotransferase family protein [Dehalococcoidia bacterium]
MSGFRIPFFRPSIDEDDIAAVADTLRSGWLTSAGNVQALERELADYTGAGFVNAVNSCTAAMHLCLRAWDIGPGDEVITTPWTFSATATVIVHTGATPVLADIREGDFNIDPEQVERAVTPRTKAIIPVHYAGEPCDMDALQDIAERHNLKILEDAAHAIGTMYRGRMVGQLSDAAAFSFYATKNMTTGEGGALATDDEALSDRVRRLTLHGMNRDAWNRYDPGGSWRYDIIEFGFKDNLTDPAAALGRRQLTKLERFTEERTRVAQRYFANLAGEEHVRLPAFDERNRQAWHLFEIRILPSSPVGRDDVIRQLAARGIQTSVHFIPLHYHTAYKNLGYWKQGDFPVAEAAFEGAISLPLFPDMTNAEVDDVCQALHDILAGAAAK